MGDEVTVTDYTLHGKLVTGLTVTKTCSGEIVDTQELHFFYDAQSRPTAVNHSGKWYTYIHNLQGDVVAILDSAGGKVVEYKYDAWGWPLGIDGTLKIAELNPFRYRGYVWDEEAELYYLRSRYYDAGIGRFVSGDTVLGVHGKIIGNNNYLYCGNEPIVFSDRNGMHWISSLVSEDKFAKKILDWYCSGNGETVITVSKEWPEYIFSKAPELKSRIDTEIKREIDKQWSAGFSYEKHYDINVSFKYELPNGEHANLLNFLHGTNNKLGGFEIKGIFKFVPKGDKDHVFFDVDCVWNDRMDYNGKYLTDRIKAAAVNFLTFGVARAFNLHIAWSYSNDVGIKDYFGKYISPEDIWRRR